MMLMELNLENKKTGSIVILLVSALGLLVVLMLDPVAQDIEYHKFKDQRTCFGLPHCWNVVSNLPFLLVGCMGIYSICYSHKIKFIAGMKAAYLLFFLGISTVAVGSSYYHLWPDNNSLVWDRLPMAIAFMSLFSIVIGEFTSPGFGKRSLWPLIILGIFSVFYWHYTENNGAGDLRLYILVQFLPVIIIPLMLLFFKATYTNSGGYWILLVAYALAKILEHFDSQIYNISTFISGHTLKHLVAALGVYFLLTSYKAREKINGVRLD